MASKTVEWWADGLAYNSAVHWAETRVVERVAYLAGQKVSPRVYLWV